MASDIKEVKILGKDLVENLYFVYIDRADSAWQETSLIFREEEGPIVKKHLKKIDTKDKFDELSKKIQEVCEKLGQDASKYPNVLIYKPQHLHFD